MIDEMNILQTVAILVDGNNMDKSANNYGDHTMLDYDRLVPRLIGRRSLSRFFYLREGKSISKKLADRLHNKFYGIVKPCHKSADVPLTIEAVQLVDKVDTIIILSGDSDYIELVKYLSARGCRTEIAAFKISVSSALIEVADFYHEINEDDCFNMDKAPEKPVPVVSNASVVLSPITNKPIKTKPLKILSVETMVCDSHNPEKTGRVISYNEKEQSYNIKLDSGEDTVWKRNMFELVKL